MLFFCISKKNCGELFNIHSYTKNIGFSVIVWLLGPWHWKKKYTSKRSTQRSSLYTNTKVWLVCSESAHLDLHLHVVPLAALPPCYYYSPNVRIRVSLLLLCFVSKGSSRCFQFYYRMRTKHCVWFPASGSRNILTDRAHGAIKTAFFNVEFSLKCTCLDATYLISCPRKCWYYFLFVFNTILLITSLSILS